MPTKSNKDRTQEKYSLEKTLTTTANLILFIAGVACIYIGCTMLAKENISLASTGLASGLILLLAATVDRFESLKGIGIEITTKKLKETIIEAKNTVQELKQLAELSGHSLSLISSKIGYISSPLTFDQGYRLTQQIRQILLSLECDESSISDSIRPWTEAIIANITVRIIGPVVSHLDETKNHLAQLKNEHTANPDTNFDFQAQKNLDTLTDYLDKRIHPHNCPTDGICELIKTFISDAPVLTNDEKNKYLKDVDPWLLEIDFLISNNYIKTPNKWAKKLNNQ